jgi:predicted aconitase with swiveling domain
MALVATLDGDAPGDVEPELRRLAETPGSGFEDLAGVIAGAYLLVPEVRRAAGYPGQAARPPRFDEAAEQIMDGILDPVIERGPIFRPTPPAPDALVIVDGEAAGPVLGATVPLSFWGGVDPASGEVIDRAHPLSGERVTGRILVLPAGRGSSSASTVLLELLAAGLGPAGIVLRQVDEVLATGAIVADRLFDVSIPMIAVDDATFTAALAAGHAEIRPGGRLVLVGASA